jgi:hypothetical protein
VVKTVLASMEHAASLWHSERRLPMTLCSTRSIPSKYSYYVFSCVIFNIIFHPGLSISSSPFSGISFQQNSVRASQRPPYGYVRLWFDHQISCFTQITEASTVLTRSKPMLAHWNTRTQVRTQNFSTGGGGADPEAIYNSRLISKLCYKNHAVSTA